MQIGQLGQMVVWTKATAICAPPEHSFKALGGPPWCTTLCNSTVVWLEEGVSSLSLFVWDPPFFVPVFVG